MAKTKKMALGGMGAAMGTRPQGSALGQAAATKLGQAAATKLGQIRGRSNMPPSPSPAVKSPFVPPQTQRPAVQTRQTAPPPIPAVQTRQTAPPPIPAVQTRQTAPPPTAGLKGTRVSADQTPSPMKKGGMVSSKPKASSASSRGDGIATKGKTKGRFV